VAWATGAQRYLVVWCDYNTVTAWGRLLDPNADPATEPFQISAAPARAYYPAVAYNALDDEFLVTWDQETSDVPQPIHGQRVRAGDGALVGANFAVGSVDGAIRSRVAFSQTSGTYLVVSFLGAVTEVWADRLDRAGTRLAGTVNLSADAIYSGYPDVSWGAAGDRFLATWDAEDGSIHGRLVEAASGATGDLILVSPPGGHDRSSSAYDKAAARFMVLFNKQDNPGYSYDQYARLVAADGALVGEPFAVAHTPGFEGETLLGTDLAFATGLGGYLASYQTDTGLSGQEIEAAGAPRGAAVVFVSGAAGAMANASDGGRRFLAVWEHQDGGPHHIVGQLYEGTAP
jgi:hypothetical protein